MQEYNTATTTTRCTAMSSRYMYGHTSAGGARPCCDCYTKAAVRCDDATTFHEFVQKAREPVLRVAKLLFTLVESSADPSRMVGRRFVGDCSGDDHPSGRCGCCLPHFATARIRIM